MAYTTLTELKTYLRIESDRDDPILTFCLASALAKVDENFTARWEATGDTRYYEQCDIEGDTLFLDAPLLSVTTLTGADGVEISASNYFLLPRNSDGVVKPYDSIRLKSGYGWDWDDDGWVSVLGNWGFTAVAPATVKQAAWRLASFYYRIKDNQTFGRVGNADLGLVELPATMPADVEELLDQLRLAYDYAGWGNS